MSLRSAAGPEAVSSGRHRFRFTATSVSFPSSLAPSRFARLGFLLSALALPGHAQTVITASFETLASPPALNDFAAFSSANSGSLIASGATWDSRFQVVGDAYIERFVNNGGSQPFATPETGHYALFNPSGADGLTFTAPAGTTLTGAWFARPSLGVGMAGTNSVTIDAISGATVLASVTLALSSTAPALIDTSMFLGLSGITSYRIDRVAIGGDPYGGGHYVADDFTFAAIPEPATTTAALAWFAALIALRRRKAARSTR